MKIIHTIILSLFFTSFSYADKNMKIGHKGKLEDVDRTIIVKMYDNYYEPNLITIKKGETIKFIITNLGEMVHEYNIGTKEMHIKHQPEMMMLVENEILLSDRVDKEKMKQMAKKNPSMGHSHSNSVLLSPGEKGELVWKFSNKAKIEAACNVPGHYEVGMIAKINEI